MHNSLVMLTFSVLDQKYLFWGRFSPKKQNFQVKVKFDTQTNSNLHNSMMMFTFLVLDRKYRFQVKFGPKWQNCQFLLKFGSYTNSSMKDSMVMFIFCFLFFLTGRILFWDKFFRKKSKLFVEAEIWNLDCYQW